MAGHSRLDALGTDALEEDLMQRGLHHLESVDCCASLEQAA